VGGRIRRLADSCRKPVSLSRIKVGATATSLLGGTLVMVSSEHDHEPAGEPIVAARERRGAEPVLGPAALGAITRRHAAASTGPWTRVGDVLLDGFGQPVALVGHHAFPARDSQPWHRADADFMTNAWADIGTLLAELARLHAGGVEAPLRRDESPGPVG
jgi:hypothetical protein